jgi:hypothetical protein
MGSLSPISLPSPTHLGIVVARFTEPLTPCAPFASNTYLYAKFPTPQANDSTPHSSFRSYTQLPNTSREGQTYLHHIVTHYDSLDDITIFTQANPFDIISPVITTVSEMVEKSLSTPIDDVTIFNPSLLHDLAQWHKINWSDPDEALWVTPSEISTMTPAPYTMGQFWFKVLKEHHPPAIRALHGACFAVRRETIRKRGKDVCERALAAFETGGQDVVNPEVGFFMERMWLPIMTGKDWLPRVEGP